MGAQTSSGALVDWAPGGSTVREGRHSEATAPSPLWGERANNSLRGN